MATSQVIATTKIYDPDELAGVLNAASIPGVRSWTVFGTPGIDVGFYPWDAAAPVGQFLPLDLNATGWQAARAVLANYVHTAPPPIAAQIDAIATIADVQAVLMRIVKYVGTP